jgi:uncharacterized protein
MGAFIHKFQTEQNKYIYDVNSNRVFRVSDVSYDIIDGFPGKDLKELILENPRYSGREIRQGHKELLENHRRRGLFSSTRPRGMAYPGDTTIGSLIEKYRQDQLILNITERCNMRCEYCAFSGRYEGKRTHSDRDMAFTTARKALDHFIENMSEKACLSFYGGEPLLKIDLIRKVIDHAESVTDKKIRYSMTTNGTLLIPEICKYIREKDFNLMVSLDGPQEVHDRYRVYANGRGTFEKIMKNLRYLKSLDENYYREKVIFSIVSAPPHRLEETRRFFSSDPLTAGNKVSFSYMDSTIQDFPYHATREQSEQTTKEREKLHKSFVDGIVEKKEREEFLNAYYENDYLRFYHRMKGPLPEIIRLNGCCIPGARRLFVTVDGTLHVCERMENGYPIGHVDQWIDIGLIEKLVADYIDVNKDCLECWACRLCSTCFAQLAVGGRFDREFREMECVAIRNRLHRMLVHYYSALETDETAWDYMMDKKLE